MDEAAAMTKRSRPAKTATAAPRGIRGGETRNRILDAALAQFREKGFAATTVDDLCRGAGVTKGAFFHHFGGKEAATLAAIEHWNATTGALFASSAYQQVADPRDRLLAYLDTRDGWVGDSAAEFCCLLGTLAQEVHASHPALRAACDAGIRGHSRTLVETIEAARRRHAPAADWSAESLAEYIQVVLQGAFVVAKARGDGGAAVHDALRHLRRHVELILPPAAPTTNRRKH